MEGSEAALGPAACWGLLSQSSVGRLALSVRALPMILPVRYVVDDASVAISLGALGMPAAAVQDSVVAFAVDRIDDSSATGWMVQMQARAQVAPAASAAGDADGRSADLVVRLVPGTLAGHRFTLRPFDPGR